MAAAYRRQFRRQEVIDYLASERHYWTHLVPVWAALPDAVKGPGDAVLVAGYPDVARARRLGYRRIVLLEHGIGQSYGTSSPGYPGGRNRDGIGLFLSPNETAAGKDRAAYPAARVEVVGDPHLARLPRRIQDGRTTVAFSFHWSTEGVPELRSALDHYRAALTTLQSQLPDVTFIGHSHPRRDLSELYEWLGWEYVRDFGEVCRWADVYVADNSSTIYEFASTGRPVLVLNAPWYRRNAEHGLRFWSASGVGQSVWSPTGLPSAIDSALGESGSRYEPLYVGARESALSIVYQPKVDPAAELLDWLSAAVPA